MIPTNTLVAVGSNVVFRITVQNVGNTTVNYLPLEDTFSGAYYQFVSSTITNNGSGAGGIIWTKPGLSGGARDQCHHHENAT